MKKILTMTLGIGCLAMVATAAPIAPPYESDMGGEDSGWTVINVVDGTPTFTKGVAADFTGSKKTGGSYEKGFVYTNEKDVDGNLYPVDDWVASPGIELKKGVAYKIQFSSKHQGGPDATSSSHLLFKLSVARGSTLTDLRNGKVLFDYNTTTNDKAWSFSGGSGRAFAYPSAIFTPDEDGVYYFGINLYSYKGSTAGIIHRLTGFMVQDLFSAVTPKIVQDFYAFNDTIAPNRELSHKVCWRLDTLDFDGAKLPDNIKYTKVEFFRNDSLVHTIADPETGKKFWWIDDASKGLTAGKHKYAAICYLNNGNKSGSTDYTMSKWVGPIDTVALPWTMANFSSIDFNKEWVYALGNTPNASGTWKKSSSTIVYAPANNKPEDAWLILPHFKADKAGLYHLKSKLRFGVNKYDGLEIWVQKGTITRPSDFKGEKAGFIPFPGNTSDHIDYTAFDIAEPGTYTLAIRRYSEKAQTTSQVTISSLTIEGTALCPLPVADLKGEIKDEKAVLTWTNPSIDNVGKEIKALSKVMVLRYNNLDDTVAVATLTVDIAPGAPMTFTDSVEKPFIYNYQVIPYIAENTHPQPAMTAFADYTWVGSKIQKLPYTFQGGGNHQETIVPAQQLFSFEYGEGAYSSKWGLYTAGFQLSMSRGKTYAHRIICPPMELKKGHYKAVISLKGGMASMPLKLAYSNQEDPANTLKGEVDFNTASYSTTYHELAPVTINVKEDGISNFVINFEGTLPSSGSYTMLTIDKIHFEYIPEVPVAVSDLKVTADADGERKAKIEWTYPTKSSMGGDAPAFTKAIVYRNSESVATLTEGLQAGAKGVYNDSVVPDAGIFTYKVEVYSEDGCAEAKEVRSSWIGKGKDIPYVCNDYTEWTLPKESGWSLVNGHAYYENEDEVTDDWGFTAPLDFKHEKYYKIEFSTWFDAAWEAVDMRLCYGADAKADGMLNLGTFSVNGAGEANANKIEFFIKAKTSNSRREAGRNEMEYITVPAGISNLGFNAKNGGSVHISDFKVNTYIPSGVEGIGEGNGICRNGNILIIPENADVVIYNLNGIAVYKAHGVSSIDINSLAKGIYVVRVTSDGNSFDCKITR